MDLYRLTDRLTRRIEDTFEDLGSAIFDPVVRLGVTGLSRAGKTVFITALVQLDPLMSVAPGIGVMYFMAVVVLTMVAAHSFDPRLIWNPGATTRSAHA